MLIDYAYNSHKQTLTISYTEPKGNKGLYSIQNGLFDSWKEDPNGEFVTWNNKRCSPCIHTAPTKFDIYQFIRQLPQQVQDKIFSKALPQIFSWDIETQFNPNEFPEPENAKFPVTVISLCNPRLSTIELGTEPLSEEDRNWVLDNIKEYLSHCDFYNSLNLEPKFRYIQCENEEYMIRYFLENLARKMPVLTGWNSRAFDQYYLQTRLKNNYPYTEYSSCSCTKTTHTKEYFNYKNQKYRLEQPDHTLWVDYMEVFEQHTMGVDKSSLSLDFVAKQILGIGKIEYEGDLELLRRTDYKKYVFYSCIDSILVQLISMKLRTLETLFAQSNYCKVRFQDAFSKIRLADALVWNYFYDNDIKVIPTPRWEKRRDTELVGAYVKEPTAGKRSWVCCNDFSSLYPSCIITCNISFENFLGSVADETFTLDEIEQYKNDPNYFVSVNNCVYRNDKDYAFKEIQSKLKSERAVAKYLSKKLYAHALADCKLIVDKKHNIQFNKNIYGDDEQAKLKELGFTIQSNTDLLNLSDEELLSLIKELELEIDHLKTSEQACKLLMNSLYGGSSHIAFNWFNLQVANDITGEGRNLIHLLENHIPSYVDSFWKDATDLHKELGISLKTTKEPFQNLIEIIAGDTDSLYTCYQNWLNTIKDVSTFTNEQIRDLIVNFNTGFLDKHNKEFMDDYYKKRHVKSIHNFELETVAYSDIRLDVKKRYAQLLAWKDGYAPSFDNLVFKSIGLEVVKPSYPQKARTFLKQLLMELLKTNLSNCELKQYLQKNIDILYEQWQKLPIIELCENKGVNNYFKYIISDHGELADIVVKPKTPYHVAALARRNWLINNINYNKECQKEGKKLRVEMLYGGKMKIYPVINEWHGLISKKPKTKYFAFSATETFPEWSQEYFPIDKKQCFETFVLEPFNRVLLAISDIELSIV